MNRSPWSEPRVLRELSQSIQKAKDRVDLGEFKSLTVCIDFNLTKVHWSEPACWVSYGSQEEEEYLNGCDDYLKTLIILISFKCLTFNVKFEK